METDSKKYELLVQELLKAQLTKSSPGSNFKVFGDKKYLGKSGHEHQIDVSAELRIAKIKIIILVECKLYSKRVGIDDVMEFATRIDDIGAHKGILVSTIGFQEGAVKIAKSRGIALVVACDLSWEMCLESPVNAMIRHEQFIKNGRKFLTWLLGKSKPEDLPRNVLELLPEMDITSGLGLKPEPFCSNIEDTDSQKGQFYFPSKSIEGRGFILVGEKTDIVVGPDSLFSLITAELNEKIKKGV